MHNLKENIVFSFKNLNTYQIAQMRILNNKTIYNFHSKRSSREYIYSYMLISK